MAALIFAVTACGGTSTDNGGQQASLSQSDPAGGSGMLDLKTILNDFDSNPAALNDYKGKSVKVSGVIAGFGGWPPAASDTTSSVITITPDGSPRTALDCIVDNSTIHSVIPQRGMNVTVSGPVDSFQAQGGEDKIQPQGKRVVVKPCTLESVN